MKVYFEEDGIGSEGISISIYVKPTTDGHGYHYDPNGDLTKFAWVNPEEARVFNSSELPDDLWYSIQHGLEEARVDESKEGKWTFDDLKYNKVNPEEVEAYIEANKRIEDIKTIEEFKDLYPIIKKSNRINRKFIYKLFSFFDDIPDVPLVNGEIGIQFFELVCIYKSLLVKIGLEEKAFFNN